jgi:hypothetical protein
MKTEIVAIELCRKYHSFKRLFNLWKIQGVPEVLCGKYRVFQKFRHNNL